ncbi:AAA family ATPase [Myroides sp. C4067]|uniref:AAA family ATPase n=1 Tax=Myroides sp. C4067 TaxID=3136765 RepID=UPI003100CACB
MIKQINIENLGIFKNFEWKTVRDSGKNIVELKKENIIYGRNYSGKTTLSRIIRALETKQISDKYIDPKFEIVLTDNTKITEKNFETNALNVRCFNEDFIKENLSFIVNHDSDITPFAILGVNSGIEAKIELINNELGSNEEGKCTLLYKDLWSLSSEIEEKQKLKEKKESDLNSQLTGKATANGDSIKKQYLKYGDINYTISKLKADINKVIGAAFVSIDEIKEELNLQVITEVERQEIQMGRVFINNYKELLTETTSLTSKVLLDANKIVELLSNNALNDWVKKGYDLHSEDRNCTCKFCGNNINPSRWEQLDKHFDEESKKLESQLYAHKSQLEYELHNLSSFYLTSQDAFYVNYQSEVGSVIESYNLELEKYKNDIAFLVTKIDERIVNIHNPLVFEYSSLFREEVLVGQLQNYNDIVTANNMYSSELSNKIKEAKEELRLLEVKRFVDTIRYVEQEEGIAEIKEEIAIIENKGKELKKVILEKRSTIDDLTRRLNNEEEGAKRVNHYLQNYFGHQNLELQASEENKDSEKKIKFNIVREGSIAYHLSEGECSIISFCYFMAKLDDIHTAGQKPIILIDDPISSLDSNHIFYIYSLINAQLFQDERFEQIFISTHNLDFLKYLKRLKLTKKNHQFFILNRYTNYSTIAEMPIYLRDYVTEFNFLFEQIYKCAKSEIVTDENHYLYYNFGNNARKFLEALLFYKYPSRIDNETSNANSKRLLKYFGNNQQATVLTDRVNNELSHLEEIFDRGMSPIEIPELKKVAQFILDKIKEKDEEQFNALLESIGEKTEMEVN